MSSRPDDMPDDRGRLTVRRQTIGLAREWTIRTVRTILATYSLHLLLISNDIQSSRGIYRAGRSE
jgi:hypothetical protein